MTNISLNSILSAVSNTLQASPNLTPDTLAAVVIGRNADPTIGFPHCRIYVSGFLSPIEDNSSYKRTYRITVEVWQEMSNKTKANAELDFATALDAVLNRLNGTWQLGIGVQKTEIVNSSVLSASINSAPMIVGRIDFDVMTLVQNPS